jgi:Flp pilus assembly protein TadD
VAAVDEIEGNAEDALVSYRRAAEVDPSSRASWEGVGRLSGAAGRFAEAEAAYRRVTELQPDDAGALTVLATLIERQERFDEALALFRRAVAALEERGEALRETRALAWTGVGTCLLAQGERDQAYTALASALTDDPEQPEALWALVPIYLDQEQWSAATSALRSLMPLRSEHPLFWVSLGRAEAGQGRWAEARVAFERALEIDENHDEARRWFGIALRVTGAYRPAEVILRDVLARRPEDGLVRLNLAIALGQLGELAPAREQFVGARRLMPHRPEPFSYEANLLLAHEQLGEARRLAEAAIEVAPDDPGALEVLARVLDRQGEGARAREVVARALAAAGREEHREYLERLASQLEDGGVEAQDRGLDAGG